MFKLHSVDRLVKAACITVLAFAPTCLHADPFFQTNLVANASGIAANTDPNLINPWGVSFTATSPFWVSDQGSGLATLYNGAGTPNTAIIVTIPGSSTPPSGPTGTVANADTSGFLVAPGGAASHFIFDNLNGSISAWASGTTAAVEVPSAGATFTGLAQATATGGTYIYAANANPTSANIQVFDANWNNVTATTFAGKFTDPNLPAGFVPFNVQAIGGNIYVTYAELTPTGTGLPGGYVDEFDANGNLIQRVASAGALYAPWGITIAPPGFGPYSGDLLVGNFGNGEILIYDLTTNTYLGTIDGTNGLPLVNPFLWSLETRTGGAGDDPNAVYFTAGIDNQQGGLFGEITTTPEPSTIIGTGTGLIALALSRVRRFKKQST